MSERFIEFSATGGRAAWRRGTQAKVKAVGRLWAGRRSLVICTGWKEQY